MTMRTKVWAAQDALLTLLQAQTWPNDVRPALGIPGRLERDSAWISGEVDDWRAEYRVSGLKAKDETFVLRVHLLTTRLGGEFEPLRDAIAVYGGLVEDAIKQDYTLGGTVMLATIVNQQLEETMLDDGRRRQALLTYSIACDAHVPDA